MTSSRKSGKGRGRPTKPHPQQVAHHQVEQRIHEGPIPAPDTLAGYNLIVPDAAERILAMAETEAAHRQDLEKKTLQSNIKDRMSARVEIKLGQVLAFILCAFVVACGTYLALNGAEWPGVVLGSTGLSGIILAYLKK